MAQRCAAYGHALSAARALQKAARAGGNAGDVLGSWRSGWWLLGTRGRDLTD